jgi:hypothetical protein
MIGFVLSAKEGSSSFLKKRTKKRLSIASGLVQPAGAGGCLKQTKVFWYFFSQKNCFLTVWVGPA